MRRLLAVGVVCSAVAGAGDLSFIAAASLPRNIVIAGALLGALALALYGVGFRALEELVPGPLGKATWLAGCVGGGLGAAVHALTGFVILDALAATPPRPVGVTDTMAAAPGVMTPLVVAATVVGLLGSGLFAVQVARGRTRLPRAGALLAPGFNVLAIGALGQLSPFPDAALAVAPNLAHLLFFGGLLLLGSPAHR